MASKWYSEQPVNRNFLAPSGFKMNLDIFGGVDFFCQRASIPDISVGFAEAQTRYRGIPIVSSGGLTYGDLRLKFIVDEDMKNYLTVHKWITQNNLAEELDNTKLPEYSNGQLEILNSNFKTNIIVVFENLFPIDLSALEFDVEDQNVEYLTADVTYKFERYYFTDSKNRRI
jgi:hypothetical protein